MTLSSWLLFTGNFSRCLEELYKRTLYFCVPKNPIHAESYLNGVTRVRMDYKDLFQKYKNIKNLIFIADPPNIMTNQQGYIGSKTNTFFKLKDAINLIRLLENKKAILFSSTKSETDDLIEIFCTKTKVERIAQTASACEGRKYTELMYLFS